MSELPDTSSDTSAGTSRSRSPADSEGGFLPLDVLTPPEPTPTPSPSGSRSRPKHPEWIRARFAGGERFEFVQRILREKKLHTVCEEADCPNVGECWAHGTATFLLMGDICTRGCTFCSVEKGRPQPLDADEPEHVADVIQTLNLDYAVLTSVDRDDLPDEGADHFARTVEAITRRLPSCRVEALVPDFHARRECVERLARSPLFVFAHNVETVPRLYRRVRSGSDYKRSLETLRLSREIRSDLVTKSSVMVGLGETQREVVQVMEDLRGVGVEAITLGQYLQPTSSQQPVFRYVPPEEFRDLGRVAEGLGFRHVVSSPLSRSSYHAWKVTQDIDS